MRNSRSSLITFTLLNALLWGLSGCFSAPEPPASFADDPQEDAETTSSEAQGDTQSTPTGESDVAIERGADDTAALEDASGAAQRAVEEK